MLYGLEEKSLFKKLARSDWKLWKWRLKVNLLKIYLKIIFLKSFKKFMFQEVLILEG